MGSVNNVKKAYEFVQLILPARDIIAAIKKADPGGNKLPTELRGWNLNAQDDYGNVTTLDLKVLLGRLVHLYYIRLDGDVLDVSNDSGRRTIVSYPKFLHAISRLALSPVDVALVSCYLARNVHFDQLRSRRGANGQHQTFQIPPDTIPGTGDFSRLLWDIRNWPEIMDALWGRFFEIQSKPLDADVIDNRPFLQARHLDSNGIYTWSIGWRRGSVFSKADIDPLNLIEFVLVRFESIAVSKPK